MLDSESNVAVCTSFSAEAAAAFMSLSGSALTVSRKVCAFLFCLLFIVQTAFAADSLYVREQQIPILIDRIDNVLYEMRIPPKKGDVLNEITIQIGDNVNLSDIQAIRLFYSGVEAPSRKGEHFSPVTYISSHIPGNTRKALESYSVPAR